MRRTVPMKTLLGLALGSLLIIGAGCGAKNAGPAAAKAPRAADEGGALGVNADDVTAPHEVRIVAKQFSFSPSEIRVKLGENVRIVATSQDVTHGLAIPVFNVNMTLEPGKDATAEFVADQKGSFPFFCSVFCGGGHGGMRGTLIVE